MFSKILIANRGEIACRVIRTARRMGIATVAVYSEADRGALHVELADEAWPIGAAPARASYLDAPAIIAAARASGSAAVHPGYGFLSENADFAAACEAAGLVFVGPPAAAIRAMGSKAAAKALMEAHGVPLVPGYHGEAQDPGRLAAEATRLGFPVLLKASAGGGGRGMRIVENAAALPRALEAARREAKGAFGDDRIIVEKYLPRPRHIEVQLFADRFGATVHLFDRDCSIQRRYQKVVEEAPAPGLDPRLRARMAEVAVAAARAVSYVGAGTVEFILAGEDFYFMEMNTRLQVEHPVTEAVTGEDLVEWQLRVAAGERLPKRQQDIALFGHAIEARLYAEDPERQFLPQTGTLEALRLPPPDLARVDSGVREGDPISRYYDPMIAKLIAHGEDRSAALDRLRQALAQTAVLGVTTNLAFLARLARHPDYAAAALDTGFIERHRGTLCPGRQRPPPEIVAAAALSRLLRRAETARRAALSSADPHSPWARADAWRLNGEGEQSVLFEDGGERREVRARPQGAAWRLALDGRAFVATAARRAGGRLDLSLDGTPSRPLVIDRGAETAVFRDGESWRLVEIDPLASRSQDDPAAGRLSAPMPGRVTQLLVEVGAKVRRGEPLMVIEAMKMEHTIAAPADGVVERVGFAVGDPVEEGAVLIAFAPAGKAGQGA
ncbi:MAG TPA: acetyl/propionyl/methylcrotonyl-CoA carboxylase subunit alpha [Stellaceae bacterium]|nr:acetyl/propionyl/methylcrotonyl-CoA carboxylase subunit alpha [Stellaceae bacterium]